MGLRTFNALQLNKVIIVIVIVRKQHMSHAHTLAGYIYRGTNLHVCRQLVHILQMVEFPQTRACVKYTPKNKYVTSRAERASV